MVSIVLAAPALQEKITELVRAGAGEEIALQERAHKYCLQIASNYSERWLGIWDKVLSRLWRTIYEDLVVDQEGLDSIRGLFLRMPCVLVPCHRSHVDYLILSYIFYKQNLPLPHIAAGENMNFWPLGAIFRQSGAFFLRRSFQGDDLYGAVFTTYLEALLNERVPVEFFFEGGRSRTGKMTAPQYGMISMIIKSFQNKTFDDLSLIPVYIGYDRVIETKSYLRELRGSNKRRESVLDVIGQLKILKHHYGNVYLNLGAPISLKSCFSRPEHSVSAMTNDARQILYRNIGRRLVSEINRVAVATPSALLAAVLLCHGEKETPERLLIEIHDAFYDYLTFRKVNLAPALASREEARKAALRVFSKEGWLVRKKAAEGKGAPRYLLPDEQRLLLEYYKNNTIHHLLPLGFLAVAILARREAIITSYRVREDYCFLKDLFRREFMTEDEHGNEMEEAVAYLMQKGVLDMGGGREEWKLKESGRKELMFFSGLVQSYLESYGTVFETCLLIRSFGIRGQNGWLKVIRQRAEEMKARGMISRTESISGESYANALRFLEEEGIISRAASPAADKGAAGGSMVNETKLMNLQHRLSGFR